MNVRKKVVTIAMTEDEVHMLRQTYEDGYTSNIYYDYLKSLIKKIEQQWPELFEDYEENE